MNERTERIAVPQGAYPTAHVNLTKSRFVELNNLGIEIYKKMNELGITENEHCTFGSIMQALLSLPD